MHAIGEVNNVAAWWALGGTGIRTRPGGGLVLAAQIDFIFPASNCRTGSLTGTTQVSWWSQPRIRPATAGVLQVHGQESECTGWKSQVPYQQVTLRVKRTAEDKVGVALQRLQRLARLHILINASTWGPGQIQIQEHGDPVR